MDSSDHNNNRWAKTDSTKLFKAQNACYFSFSFVSLNFVRSIKVYILFCFVINHNYGRICKTLHEIYKINLCSTPKFKLFVRTMKRQNQTCIFHVKNFMHITETKTRNEVVINRFFSYYGFDFKLGFYVKATKILFLMFFPWW